ncbi:MULTISPECIES: RNA polymerase sigma factor [Sphingobium]|uniref:RNA polymerase sigma factor n=1 Tax=Sphingobium TaxID=165695 RepID=UPI000E7369E6|nr:sigma-70 family RNA polymerase sigma factor [Sphingobium sp. YG1]
MSQGRSEDRVCGPIRQRDSGAEPFRFPDFYNREKPRLMRFFTRQLGNQADADELAQEAFTRFVRTAPVQALENAQAYLTRIATNLLRDFIARGSTLLSKRSMLLDEDLDLVAASDTHRETQARQDLARWKLILEQLKPETLDIFLRNRVEGQTYVEIARELDVPLWVVQKQMLKAMKHVLAHREANDD